MKVELNMPNYPTNTYLKCRTGVETLTILKLDINELDINKLETTAIDSKVEDIKKNFLMMINIFLRMVLIDFQLQNLMKDLNKQNQKQKMLLILLNSLLIIIRKTINI